MIRLLAKIFIRKNGDTQRQRRAYGVLCGAVGIALNALLFGAKLAVGLFARSVSITADAFNNLSDAGSSAVTLFGFRLAGQRPDSEHPFGHGRFEYISGLIVSLLIMLMGAELARSSIKRILAPEAAEFSIAAAVVLGLSILVKLYMYFYNRKIGKQLDSVAMRAAATDSLADCVATGSVLVCMLLSRYISLDLDGWCGAAVSVFIIIGGIKTAVQTINPLLGQPPSGELVREIETLVTSREEVLGVHDLIVHDYGPGRRMLSLHAEVRADADLLKTHDTIDNIERELSERLGCAAVIHMDPIETDDELTTSMRDRVAEFARTIDQNATIHDFRLVKGHTHTNVVFDIVVPYNLKTSDGEIKRQLSAMLRGLDESCYTAISVDRSGGE